MGLHIKLKNTKAFLAGLFFSSLPLAIPLLMGSLKKSFPSSFKLPFSCQKTYTAFPPHTVFAQSDFFSLSFFLHCLLEFKVMFTYLVLHPVRRFPFSSNGLLIKTTPTAQAHDFSSSPHTHTALHLNSVGPQTYK